MTTVALKWKLLKNTKNKKEEISTASKGKTWNIFSVLFLLAFLVLPFIYSDQMLDRELVPKFLFLALFGVIGLIATLFSKKIKSLSFSLIDFSFLAYTVWLLLSIIWSINLGDATYTALTTTLLFLSYFLTRLYLKQHEKSEQFLYITAGITSLVLCLYGWNEFASLSEISQNQQVYQVKGFSGHKNLFVLQLFMLEPFLLIGYLKTKSKLKYAYLGIGLLILMLLISLLARAFMAGFITTLVVAFVLFLASKRQSNTSIKWKPILLVSLILIGGIAGVFATKGDVQLLKRYNISKFSKSRNAQERMNLWSNTVELIKDRPIHGFGAGSWPYFYPSKSVEKIPRLADGNLSAARPHNDYLWIASETGIVGLLLYLSIFALVFYFGLKALFKGNQLEKNESEDKNAIIVLISFLTGYLVISFFDFPRERAELNFLLAILIGILAHLSSKEVSIKSLFQLNNTGQIAFKSVLIGLLGFALYVGYARYQGEVFTKKITVQFQKNNLKPIFGLIEKSKNLFYTVDPTETPMDFYACHLHRVQKNREKAIEYCLSAIKESPYQLKVLLTTASLYGESGDYENGATYFEKAYAVNPLNEKVIEGLAICYFNSGRKAQAKELVKDFDSEHPSILMIRDAP